MTQQNTRLGILFMIAATLVFTAQDALSRMLGAHNNVFVVVMIRYWFFAAFVIALALRSSGGLRGVLRSRYPVLQSLRGLLLVAEICVMVIAFVKLGLIATHAVFACYPLLVSALSGPVLGETVGWRRWTAVAIGFVGVIIILNPGAGVLSFWSLVPLAAAAMFAIYGLLTRYVARGDGPAVSFFWAGTVGAVAITIVGLISWQPLRPEDWPLMATLCCTGVLGHWCLIRSFDAAEASAVQPFSFLQILWATGVGVFFFHEELHLNILVGAGVVIAAGLFTLWRAKVKGEVTPAAPR
ncbi:DMT family transporter [Falsirhodobacter xinxiangensis]|uniref:DMT family transporter n=1 Tax=Falsirhodobacter xinxiangensis TaxID=2530049 RepID=UPI0010AA139C|nr:DMT family transporter [Rhodobacter xinxiangensis]